jgi:spermidine synthase
MVIKSRLFWDDVLLILTMATLAACGLIYEYLLSHYAGRVLGIMESTIYAMIGLMIVAMGLGAFTARKIRCAFNGFVYLELTVALLGCSCILVIALLIGFSQILPSVLAQTFNLPADIRLQGGFFKQLSQWTLASPYLFGFLLGFFIGMEIPLIARIRETVHQKHLANNLGTIYGADYIGAGIGAALWVTLLLTIDISQAGAITASVNLLVGLLFMLRFWHLLTYPKTLLAGHAMLAGLILLIFTKGNLWLNQMSNLLYLDEVVYSSQTRYQQLNFTRRYMGQEEDQVINFYLNGRLQFSSNDEIIYHGYLVEPAMALSARQHKILVIGGGDGLALRDILTWQPQEVTLIDLDKELLNIFKQPDKHLPATLATTISQLNQGSLNDPRVHIIYDDAFLAINQLLAKNNSYDVIIVDLPDPSHPDLNKLYSVNFYARLKHLLNGDGIINIQSTSPYHAKNAFISIKKTLTAAGFTSVEQLHANVPSFGEWGWTLASKQGLAPSQRLKRLQAEQQQLMHPWLTLGLVRAAMEFPKNFYQRSDAVEVNYLGSHTIYQYHQQAWQKQQGLNEAHVEN